MQRAQGLKGQLAVVQAKAYFKELSDLQLKAEKASPAAFAAGIAWLPRLDLVVLKGLDVYNSQAHKSVGVLTFVPGSRRSHRYQPFLAAQCSYSTCRLLHLASGPALVGALSQPWSSSAQQILCRSLSKFSTTVWLPNRKNTRKRPGRWARGFQVGAGTMPLDCAEITRPAEKCNWLAKLEPGRSDSIL